jgi:hypothetical protein
VLPGKQGGGSVAIVSPIAGPTDVNSEAPITTPAAIFIAFFSDSLHL